MTIFQRLQKRLHNECHIDAYDFKRTRAGINQRRAGAFLWEAKAKQTWTIGSCDTATDCVKAKSLEVIVNPFCEIEIVANEK